MPHDHLHNHPADHLHSHMSAEDEAADLQVLCDQFIEGFQAATDKQAFLRLAGVPTEMPDPDGGPGLKLVDVKLTTQWQVGSAAPAFGSRELSYLPFPGEMISERCNLEFLYVSLKRTHAVDLRDHLSVQRAHR